MDEQDKPQEEVQQSATDPDGYYGEDEMDDEELDLSFLDEDDDDEEKHVH